MRTGPKSKWNRPSRSVFSSAPNGAACHQDVRSVAVALAHEAYAALMSRNDWYDALKRANPGVSNAWLEKGWVNEHWPEFLSGARATMAQMLAGPLPEHLKESISEALILDATLTRGRANGARILGAKA